MAAGADKVCKIVLVGDGGVGKTQMMQRYTKNTFSLEQRNTIGVELSWKMVKVASTLVRMQLWDTGGQERFRCINAPYFRDALGVVLVYDITSHPTFQSVPYWLAEVREKCSREAVLCLVGNKADLEERRQVRKEEASGLAQREGIVWLESSAKDGTNISKAFEDLTREIVEKDLFQSSSSIVQLARPARTQRKSRRFC